MQILDLRTVQTHVPLRIQFLKFGSDRFYMYIVYRRKNFVTPQRGDLFALSKSASSGCDKQFFICIVTTTDANRMDKKQNRIFIRNQIDIRTVFRRNYMYL